MCVFVLYMKADVDAELDKLYSVLCATEAWTAGLVCAYLVLPVGCNTLLHNTTFLSRNKQVQGSALSASV